MEKLWQSIVGVIYKLKDMLDLTSPIRVIMLAVDLLLVSFIIYYIIRIIKKTRAEQIFKGILVLLFLLILSKICGLVILDFILTNVMTYSMLLFIVVFQPELRSALEKLGRRKIVDIFDIDDKLKTKQIIAEITKAVEIMALKKIGALIVIEKSTKIGDVVREGIDISAKVSSELIQTIFMPRTPLHDGAIVIAKNKIAAASCVLPLASENMVPKNLGTRHRAAVGMSEVSDALVIVVSEEKGIISLAKNGKIKENITGDELNSLLFKELNSNTDHIMATKMKEKIREQQKD